MKKIIFLFCISYILLTGCGKKEINALKSENQQLKNTIIQLQKEIKSLKETDQGHFSAAVDSFNAADNKQKWQQVAEQFKVFQQKFPNSQYVLQAQSYLEQANNKVRELQRVQDALQHIEEAVQKQHWKTARQTLQNIKSTIPTEQYEKLKKYIYEESHKPIQTTINEIISNKEKFIGKRVFVKTSFSSFVNRKRKSLDGYSGGCTEGSSIEIFYDKTSSSTIQFFTNNDPKCHGGKRWQVVGTVNHYGNSYNDLYIQAESIQ